MTANYQNVIFDQNSEFLLELTTSDAHFQMMQCHDKNKDQFLLHEQLLLILMIHSVHQNMSKVVQNLEFFSSIHNLFRDVC